LEKNSHTWKNGISFEKWLTLVFGKMGHSLKAGHIWKRKGSLLEKAVTLEK